MLILHAKSGRSIPISSQANNHWKSGSLSGSISIAIPIPKKANPRSELPELIDLLPNIDPDNDSL